MADKMGDGRDIDVGYVENPILSHTMDNVS